MKIIISEIQKRNILTRLLFENNETLDINPNKLTQQAVAIDLKTYLGGVNEGEALVMIFGEIKSDKEDTEYKYEWDMTSVNVLFFQVIANDKLMTTKLKNITGPGPMKKRFTEFNLHKNGKYLIHKNKSTTINPNSSGGMTLELFRSQKINGNQKNIPVKLKPLIMLYKIANPGDYSNINIDINDQYQKWLKLVKLQGKKLEEAFEKTKKAIEDSEEITPEEVGDIYLGGGKDKTNREENVGDADVSSYHMGLFADGYLGKLLQKIGLSYSEESSRASNNLSQLADFINNKTDDNNEKNNQNGIFTIKVISQDGEIRHNFSKLTNQPIKVKSSGNDDGKYISQEFYSNDSKACVAYFNVNGEINDDDNIEAQMFISIGNDERYPKNGSIKILLKKA